MLHNLFTHTTKCVEFITQKRVYIASFMLLMLLATSALFYQHANHFSDVDYHIPATILAQSHGYDLEGYGLSFVKSDVLLATSALFYQHANHFSDVDYHIPATILAQSHGYDLEGYGLSFVKSDELGTLSFSHYQSAIGVQGFFYAWLYQSLGLENLKPLYKLTAFCNALALLICAFLLGRIFGRAFGIIFFLSLFTSSWVANFSGSLYFSLAFWILPAILAFSIYIYIRGAISAQSSLYAYALALA